MKAQEVCISTLVMLIVKYNYIFTNLFRFQRFQINSNNKNLAFNGLHGLESNNIKMSGIIKCHVIKDDK